jgi:hypothetical protein
VARQDYLRKGLRYALALLPLLLLQGFVLGRLPLRGYYPALLPLFVAVVAGQEGSAVGAVAGIAAGFCTLAQSPAGGAPWIAVDALLGAVTGGVTGRPGIRGAFCKALLAGCTALLLLDAGRLAAVAAAGSFSLSGFAQTAGREGLATLAAFPLVFLLCHGTGRQGLKNPAAGRWTFS